MSRVLTAKRPRGATGLELLRDVAAQHHGPIAKKHKLKEAADNCYNNVQPVQDRCDLRFHLTEHLRYVKYLADNGQSLGDAMIEVGLLTLVEKLQMTTEIETATNILEACGQVWTSTNLLEILNRRADEWIFLPKSSVRHTAAKASPAAASVNRNKPRYTPTCHNWLGTGQCNRSHCHFEHTPEHKGRSDLLPFCPHLDDTGKCTRENCMFKHYPDATLPPAPAPEVAAAATQPKQPTSEMDELKAMILTLMQEGAAQKALMTAFLTEEVKEE
jgi:hypothetical protein